MNLLYPTLPNVATNRSSMVNENRDYHVTMLVRQQSYDECFIDKGLASIDKGVVLSLIDKGIVFKS